MNELCHLLGKVSSLPPKSSVLGRTGFSGYRRQPGGAWQTIPLGFEQANHPDPHAKILVKRLSQLIDVDSQHIKEKRIMNNHYGEQPKIIPIPIHIGSPPEAVEIPIYSGGTPTIVPF
jgi:hypothetical protein